MSQSTRSYLVELLREKTDLAVLDYVPNEYTGIKAPTVFVTPEMSIDWGESFGFYRVDTALALVAPFEDYKRSEDALEANITVVLNALSSGNLRGSIGTATRVVFAEKRHGYEIKLSISIQKNQESA